MVVVVCLPFVSAHPAPQAPAPRGFRLPSERRKRRGGNDDSILGTSQPAKTPPSGPHHATAQPAPRAPSVAHTLPGCMCGTPCLPRARCARVASRVPPARRHGPASPHAPGQFPLARSLARPPAGCLPRPRIPPSPPLPRPRHPAPADRPLPALCRPAPAPVSNSTPRIIRAIIHRVPRASCLTAIVSISITLPCRATLLCLPPPPSTPPRPHPAPAHAPPPPPLPPPRGFLAPGMRTVHALSRSSNVRLDDLRSRQLPIHLHSASTGCGTLPATCAASVTAAWAHSVRGAHAGHQRSTHHAWSSGLHCAG